MIGKLTVICGPMFAGKTTELLKRILWERNGLSKAVLVIKPAFDDRYSTTKICSHDGLSVDALSINKWEQVAHCIEDAEIICIDEIQFFNEEHFDSDIIKIIRDLLLVGKQVVVTGLDMDWQALPFELTAKAMAMADDVIKLKAHCTVCGKPAKKTFKEGGGSTIELGHVDKYEARCNDHWSI